jgi:pyruvate,water dikinase
MVTATQVQSFQASKDQSLILWFEEVGIEDIPLVGGKNASLGEMIQQLTPKGVNVPTGFATTAYAYRYFIKAAGLEEKLRKLFADLDVNDVSNLQKRGKQARSLILSTAFPQKFQDAIAQGYRDCAIAMVKIQKLQFARLPPLKICRMLALRVSRKLI